MARNRQARIEEDPPDQAMTLSELRWFFWILVALLGASLVGAGPALWVLAAALAIAGALPLYAPGLGERAAAGVLGALGKRLVRVSLAIPFAILVLCCDVFSPSFAIFAGTFLVALALAIACWRGADALGTALVTIALGAIVTVTSIAIGEAVLSLDPLARHFGTPAEKARWRAHYDEQTRNNVFGLRSSYENISRSPNSLRIVAVGDSFTFGAMLEDPEEAWPARLERRLAERHPASRVEVINMGKPGFTSANNEERLRRLGWQFSPDLVVVQFLCNDPIPSTENFGVDVERVAQLYGRIRLLPAQFRRGSIEKSALFDLIEGRLSSLISGSAIPRYHQLFDDDDPGWIQAQETIRAIADEGSRRRVPVIFMLFPEFFPGEWTPENYPLRDDYAKAGRVAARAGMHVLDLIPVFAAQGGDWHRWWASSYDGHPDPSAHEIAAEALAAFMLSSDFYWSALPRDVSSVTRRPERPVGDRRQSEVVDDSS